MNNLRRLLPTIGLVLVSLVLALPLNAFLFRTIVPPNTAELSVLNKTGGVVQLLEVKFCQDTERAESIADGVSAVFKFVIAGDCHYSIAARISGGKVLASETGYVSSGSDFKDSVILEGDRISQGLSEVSADPSYVVQTTGLFLGYFAISGGIYFLLRYGGRRLKRSPA
ncbi:hypothetical protein BH10BDE1_BH10BDE1_23630 [soil metagenome]